MTITAFRNAELAFDWALVHLIGLSLLAISVASATEPPDSYVPNEVYRSPDATASVESLGSGVYLFRWWPGLYVSPFLVGEQGVLAVDPINEEVAELYRMGIAAVTDSPVTKILYSHDHQDHIAGARVLAPDAQRIAHPGTAKAVASWANPSIPAPTILVSDGDRVSVGQRSVGVHYFGPNHGDSNLALSFETSDGMMLVMVDTIEIGITPYRSLPDTHLHGYLTSLEQAMELQPRWVLGGHSGPGPGIWLNNFHQYFLDMRTAVLAAETEVIQPPANPDEDFIDTSERHIDAIIKYTVDTLRPSYGHWRGFEQWAPMNAQTIRMAIIIGK